MSADSRRTRQTFRAHKDLEALNAILPHIRKLQQLASSHGIFDIFQDNGGKLLQVLLVTGLKALPGREGNDAVDELGNEYELKTVNRFDTAGRRKKGTPQFTTHHHLNPRIIEKYKRVAWIFAVYSGIELELVYLLTPRDMAPLFEKWASDFHEKQRDLNNPKVSLKFVQENGTKLFDASEDLAE